MSEPDDGRTSTTQLDVLRYVAATERGYALEDVETYRYGLAAVRGGDTSYWIEAKSESEIAGTLDEHVATAALIGSVLAKIEAAS